MWTRHNKDLTMKILGGDLLRRFTCGSGVLFGSVLLANQFKEEKEKRWSVITEYPKSKPNDVLLSRYGLLLLISAGWRHRKSSKWNFSERSSPKWITADSILDYTNSRRARIVVR
jgi:hypothetical protein